MYTQCLLEKPKGSGKCVQIAMIPEKFAKLGTYLEIKNGEFWENGWLVKQIFVKCTDEEATRRRDEHRVHRTITDV